MTNSIIQLSQESNQILQALQVYPFIIFIFALVFLGRLLRSSVVSNQYITWILCGVGAMVTPSIADIIPIVKDLNLVMKISAGFCLGWLSTGLFEAVTRLPLIRSNEFLSKLLGFEVQK